MDNFYKCSICGFDVLIIGITNLGEPIYGGCEHWTSLNENNRGTIETYYSSFQVPINE